MVGILVLAHSGGWISLLTAYLFGYLFSQLGPRTARKRRIRAEARV